MARQKVEQSLASQMEKVSALERKLAKEKDKVKRMQETDNIRLGKLVKKIFKDVLPEDKVAQEEFFKGLVKYADMSENENVETNTVEDDDVKDVAFDEDDDDSFVTGIGVISAPDD